MSRRGWMVALTFSILAALVLAEAQPASQVHRIGYLTDGIGAQQEYFIQGLRDLGYIAHQNLVIERRFAHHDPARLPALAAELAGLKFDVIVVGGTAAALAAQRATATLPVVMGFSGDPLKTAQELGLTMPPTLLFLADEILR